MIGLRRSKVRPPILCTGGKGATAAAAHERSWVADPSGKFEFEPHWQKPDVRGALHAMQGWVCAYCQRKIDPRETKHVDHFRPKNGTGEGESGGYWWLAYSFDNYLLSCGLCNERKGDRFPIEKGAARATYETRDRLLEEARLLTDPACDPVTQWLKVDVDDVGGHYGDVVARPHAPASVEARRTKETIKFFALNDDHDHLRDRIRLLEKLTKLHAKGRLNKLTRRANRYRPHSLTARSFLEAYAPELLPSAMSELRWFLEKLCKRLKAALDLRARRGLTSGSCLRRANEIAWTLAVLWKDPPVGSSDDVANWLDEMECRGLIKRYHDRLV